jgi:drug/metabolite transporter (DMT)-like permease
MPVVGFSPIGLFFAALVAVLLAIGQVFNKKVVEGQDVISAVFWIRLFAAMVLPLVVLGFILKGSPPVIHAPAAIVQGDLQNFPALVDRLRNPANPAIQKIVGNLSETTRKQLANYQSGVDDAQLSKSLRDDFNSNRIIKGQLLYNPSDFAGVTLSTDTLNILGKKPHGEVQSYANRLLVDDLFPGVIAPSRNIALFGMKSVMVSPMNAYGVYLLIEIILVGASQLLNSYALKIAPISLCVPFTAFTPIFVLFSGYIVLSELPTVVGMMGICLIVVGGMLMHRKLFSVSWKAPIEAIFKEKGSRYMVLSVLLAAIFSPLEKQLVLMSDALTASFVYGIGTVFAFWILCLTLRVKIMQVMREVPMWAVLCGVMDAAMMLAQFFAVMYLPVVITMCIKRGGIVLTVLAGWIFFKERNIADRLIASMAMVGGIVLFYLPLQIPQAMTLTCIVVAGLAVALYLTRHAGRKNTLAAEPVKESA